MSDGLRLLPPADGRVLATVDLPASKSISNRALILNALSRQSAAIENLSDSDDTRVLREALSAEGDCFDIGAAGTAMRFLTAYLANRPGRCTLTGSDRMKQRPIGLLVEALNRLGGRIAYLEKEGYPPLRIDGQVLQGGCIDLDGSLSSQYVSALLMVAPCMKQGLRLRLRGKLASLPYIRMTTRLMAAYGVQVEFREDTLTVRPQEYKALPFRVEADWSAASYWFALLAVCGEGRVLLRGLSPDSLQGDALVARLFQGLGVDSRFIGEGLLLQAVPRSCQRMDYDFTNEPDLAQTFVVACCLMNLPFSFTGLHSLKIKETDRIDALCRELHKLGYPLSAEGEGRLEWTGERCPAEAAPRIATYADHRMAMAFAPAAFAYPQGGLTIENPQVVSKSYPRFWNDLRSAAFQLVEN